jgi:hypothetical protein
MFVYFSYVLLLVALLVASGCADSGQLTMPQGGQLPVAAAETFQTPLSDEKNPDHRELADEGHQPEKLELDAESVKRTVARVTYLEDFCLDPSCEASAATFEVGHEPFNFGNEALGVEAPLPAIALEPLSKLSSVEYLPELERSRLSPLEPLRFESAHWAWFASQANDVVNDYQQFYSPDGMIWLAGGLGVAAVMANTGFDEHFVRDAYLENIVLAPSDELYEQLHEPKFLGEGYYTIPVFAIAALAGPISDAPVVTRAAEWGQRSLRSIVVGAPPLFALQWLTGGSRPTESAESSEWQPFHDNNGVSGHAAMGAIPFISAAKLTDRIWLKSGLYAASTLPGLSRINDDAHYFSQAMLGWWIAYLAESAVDRSCNGSSCRTWQIYPSSDGAGLMFSRHW